MQYNDFLMTTKYISDKNWYEQILLMKLCKFLAFQFGESARHKILCSKSFIDFDEIFVRFGQISLNFSGGHEIKISLQSILQEAQKTEKWPFLASIT